MYIRIYLYICTYKYFCFSLFADDAIKHITPSPWSRRSMITFTGMQTRNNDEKMFLRISDIKLRAIEAPRRLDLDNLL